MRKGDDRRDALTGAAARLFWQRGYASTSLADIAAASGVPVGNVYYYYRSKAELARAVAAIFVEETAAMLAGIEAREAEPRARLAALVGTLSNSLRSRVEHGCPIALCVRDFRIDADEAAEVAAQSFSLIIGFIARELGRTGMRPANALALARGAVCEWQGGTALAHSLKDAAVLSESFRRMEQLVGAVPRRDG